MKQKGLFDEEDRLRVLSKLGDSLEKLNEQINKDHVKVDKKSKLILKASVMSAMFMIVIRIQFLH